MSVQDTMTVALVLQTLREQLEQRHFWARGQNVLHRFQFKSNRQSIGSLKVKNIWKLYFNSVEHTNQRRKSACGGLLFKKISQISCFRHLKVYKTLYSLKPKRVFYTKQFSDWCFYHRNLHFK